MGIDKLDTVRKLLAKADGAATPAEAEVYTAKAVELMARHGIDEALLAAAAPDRDEVATCRIPVADPYSAGKARLLAWTASALRCRAVLHEAGGRAGRGGHRARVRLRPGAGRAAVHVVAAAGEQPAGGQRPAWAGESVAAYRRSWLHGFAVRVHQRLVEAEARAAESAEPQRAASPSATGPSVALVLADRSARVDRAYAEEFPQIGRARRAQLSGSGYAAGAHAGARADLGGRAVAPTGRRALDG